jgi:5-methylcytosine-specific restriction endonuclease McrA
MKYLETHCVLKLNKNWQPFFIDTGMNALINLYKGTVRAINIEYAGDEPQSFEPLTWDKWVKLPVGREHFSVHTTSFKIRIPTVVICERYNKIPVKRRQLTKQSIFERDHGICQYTGQKLSYKTASIDHVVPKSKGGKHRWDNVVISHIDVNCRKSDLSVEQAGLKLLKKPAEPKALPASFHIKNEHKIKDWNYFLINGAEQ